VTIQLWSTTGSVEVTIQLWHHGNVLDITIVVTYDHR